MTTEKYEWLNPTGGTAIVYYNPDTQTIENMLMNLIEGHEPEFKQWVSDKTGLPFSVVNDAYGRYEPRITPVSFPNQRDETGAWMVIPDEGYDRALVELLCKGHTYKEIYLLKHFAIPATMMNRISELRNAGYKIPTQREIQKMIRDKIKIVILRDSA